MKKNDIEILYKKKEAFNTCDYYKINISQEKNTLTFLDKRYSNYNSKPESMVINDKVIMNFLDSFFRIVDTWNAEYTSGNSFDGTEWEIIIKYSPNRVKKITGHGDYPNNFDLMETLIHKMIQSVLGEII